MTSRVDEAVGMVSLWKGQEPKVAQLSGGLTNENYLVEARGQKYVMRIPGHSTELLSIDRANEVFNWNVIALQTKLVYDQVLTEYKETDWL